MAMYYILVDQKKYQREFAVLNKRDGDLGVFEDELDSLLTCNNGMPPIIALYLELPRNRFRQVGKTSFS